MPHTTSDKSTNPVSDFMKEFPVDLLFGLPILAGFRLLKDTSWKTKAALVSLVVIPKLLIITCNLALEISSRDNTSNKKKEQCSEQNVSPSADLSSSSANPKDQIFNEITTCNTTMTLSDDLGDNIDETKWMTL